MGLQQSKEAALYLQASCGNVDGIRALHRDGAGLEWVDKEGWTPLILACTKPDGVLVAKALIELGANVNAYRPGSHAGTPLHHAAKKGLTQTVNLLLSHGANVYRVNDDCQTALDLARAKGHCNVVRAIENHISIFSGWLREMYGPGFLEVLAPQLVTRKIWAVVLPQDYHNPVSNQRLELAIYPTLQVAQPQTICDLQKVTIEDVNFDLPDPVVIIDDKINKKHFKFLSGNEVDKQQLLRFYMACKGMIQHNGPSQARRDGSAIVSTAPVVPSGSASQIMASPPVSEDAELAMAISASIQSAIAEGARHVSSTPLEPQNNSTSGWDNSKDTSYNGWAPPDQPSASLDAINGWADEVQSDSYNGWSLPESEPSTSSQNHETHMPTILPSAESDLYSGWVIQESQPRTSQNHGRQNISTATGTPSAPPISEDSFTRSAVHYPSVDFSPIDQPIPGNGFLVEPNEKREASGTCVICLDAKVEGACIPCGHMAGCMSCLNEIKSKGGGCPVCRAKIDQVLRLFSV